LALFLGALVLWPLITMLREPTGEEWVAVARSSQLRQVTLNTLLIGVLSTTSATALGAMFGYALSRVDMAGKRIFRVVAIIPLVSPPFVVGLALLLLFGRRGAISYGLLGMDFSLSGLPGLWLVQTVAFFPIAALATAPVFRNISTSMEWAAWDAGYSWFGVFRRVTLPNVKWGLMYGVLLCNARAMGEFGAVSVVSGHIRGVTNTMPLHVEILYNEYNWIAAFAGMTSVQDGAAGGVARGGKSSPWPSAQARQPFSPWPCARASAVPPPVVQASGVPSPALRPSAVPSPAERVRVRVCPRAPGLAARAAEEFRNAGWPIDEVGNYPQGVIPTTTVYYRPGTDEEAPAPQHESPV
jgi:ABC-type sulfate transport system permease subunit